MDQYIATMKKYEPKWTYDDLAFQGYLNAVQFVQGLKEEAATEQAAHPGRPDRRHQQGDGVHREGSPRR